MALNPSYSPSSPIHVVDRMLSLAELGECCETQIFIYTSHEAGLLAEKPKVTRYSLVAMRV